MQFFATIIGGMWPMLRMQICSVHRARKLRLKLPPSSEFSWNIRTCRSFSPTGERAGWNCNVYETN